MIYVPEPCFLDRIIMLLFIVVLDIAVLVLEQALNE